MSSPVILTGVRVPHEEAIAGNREACRDFLERAESAWATLEARAKALAKRGFLISPPSTISMDAARQRVRELFPQESGWLATQFAHSYYQSVKHPWSERLAEAEQQVATVEAEQQEMARADRMTVIQHRPIEELAADARRIASQLRTQLAQGTSVRRLEEKDEHQCERTLEARIHAATKQILSSACSDTESADLSNRIRSLLSRPGPLLIVELEELALSCRDANARRVNSQIEALVRTQETERMITEFRQLRQSASHLLTTVGISAAASFNARFDACEAQALDGHFMAAENGFAHTHAELVRAAASRSALLSAVSGLKKLGYIELQDMETITAEDLLIGVYQMPGDPSHQVEIKFHPAREAIHIQAVRDVNQATSNFQAEEDTRAQQKLCSDLRPIIEEISGAGLATVASCETPGKPMPTRNICRTHRTTLRSSKTHAQARLSAIPK